MENNFKGYHSKTFIWMPMIGFDREQPDKGASMIVNRAGFTPDAIAAFLFHEDFVHQYEGMDHEYTLPPDMCSYYASARNEERERQDWTNYDVRTLNRELSKLGVKPLLGIMGVQLGNKWHHEWLYDHPEIRVERRTGSYGLNVLKRFNDGTYYEDFFADKLCEVLTAYDFGGLQVADNFCPLGGSLCNGDFSLDMAEQFTEHTGIEIPKFETTDERATWIWSNLRAEWVRFYGWRWAKFWKKICDRLHAIGKIAMVLGMYCTDPFETLYIRGVDLKLLSEAGVDILMPNIVPTGLRMTGRDDYYYKLMAMAPLTSAYAPKSESISLLGVKDATEEWDVLHHAPVLLERDIYNLSGYLTDTGNGLKRSLDGLIMCLGDGIYADEWKWLRERFEVGFYDVNEIDDVLAPSVVWSDTAFDNTLEAYMNTRRWTLHKYFYEMENHGVKYASIIRTDNLDINKKTGTLFVPNFDLMSEDEKKLIAAYRNGPVICTAVKDSVDFAAYGIEPTVYFEDKFSTVPACAFVFNYTPENLDETLALTEVDDGSENLDDPFNAPETQNTLEWTLKFSKVNEGFVQALADILKASANDMFICDTPINVIRMKDGRYRLYVYNMLDKYLRAAVTACKPVKKVDVISKFPLLPVKFMATPGERVGFIATESDGTQSSFSVRLAPRGVSIVDVTL